MKIETDPLSFRSAGRRTGVVLGLLAALSSCASAEKSLETTRAEAHFSVACPPGSTPAITEVAHSGVIPKSPAGKSAGAVVRLACSNENQDPTIVQDTEHGGACLGYGAESHLVVVATQPGQQSPEFFVASRPEIGVVGAAVGSSDLAITKAQLHHHSLEAPFDQAEYQRNHCSPS